MKHSIYILYLCFLLISWGMKVNAQSPCNPNVPSFNVDLSFDPNAVWISPDTIRNDYCCGATSPDKCVEFVITLHPDAEGIIFDIYSGAVPPGALFYQVACGPPTMVGEPLCLSGTGPHYITFCKPGNNQNEYSITSVADPDVGPDISVNDGCFGQIYVVGYEPTSINWTSVYPGVQGAYDVYLDCTTCDSVNVVAQPGFPPYVDYQICGYPFGGCDTTFTCDTVRSYFNSTLMATITPINPTVCFGAAGTTITANGSGGTSPYNYTWSTLDTTQSIYVGVGTYYVTLGDSSGCPPTTDTVTVTEFDTTIIANAGPDQIVCSDNIPVSLSGSVIAATGGIWSGGSGLFSPNDTTLNATYTPTATEISNGSVELYLTTTGNGTCPADVDTIFISLVQFNAAISVSVDSVNCSGGNDGSATISLTGGVNPFTITWNTSPVQTGLSATGLSTGTYTATLSDGNNCDTTISVTVYDPSLLTSIISDSTNVSCNGFNDGSATVTASGGTMPYSYQWDVNTGNQTTAMADSLTEGTYNVVVTDYNGCSSNISVTLTEPSTAITINLTINDVSCYGGSNGSITATPSGGTPPYNYIWSSNAGNQTTPAAINLPADTYSIMVTDTNGCVVQPGIIVNQPPLLTHTTSFTPVNCKGGSDGTATITPAGGTTPYSYLWDANAGNQTTATAIGLMAGSYLVTVTDTNGCQDTVTVTVTEPAMALSLLTSMTPVNCKGDSDGTATVTAAGGTPSYTYLWDVNTGNQTDTTATDLMAGTYLITVTDTNGCQDTMSVLVTEPALALSLSTSMTPVNCKGGSDGTATVTATGGTPSYTYLWDANAGNQTDTTATGLMVGTYLITVTDTNGCQDTTSVLVTEPALALSLSMSMTPVNCKGGSDGTATVTALGGTTPYTYLWDANAGNQTTTTATGLMTGSYLVTVADTNGCQDTTSVLVTEPALVLSLSTSMTPVNCKGGSDGTATVTALGGTTPYTYLWDSNAGNQTTTTATGLMAGSYLVTVADTNGCQDTITAIVNQPTVLSLSTSMTPVNCKGGSDGTATVTASGATPPYTYLWDANTGNQTDTTTTGLIAGTYVVTVTDTNGCQDTISAQVTEPAFALSLLIGTTAVSCNGGSDGTATVTASGATPPYTYLWDANTGNQTSATATGLIAGNYLVTVTDTNGCQDTISAQVTEPAMILTTTTQDDTICVLDVAQIEVFANGGNGGYSYSWSDSLPDASMHNVSPLETATYTVVVTDSLGCTSTQDDITVYIRNLFTDSINVIYSGDVCVGNPTQVQGYFEENIGPYTYSWNQGLGSVLGPFNVAPATTTTYVLTVTDQCNNVVSDSITVNVFPYPVVNLPTVIGNGCEPLVVNFSDTINDSTTMMYNWNFGDGSPDGTQASESHLYTTAGTYNITLTITSFGGCSTTSSNNPIVIVNPPPVSDFSANPTIADMQFPNITFINTSIDAIAYHWTFGDGDTSSISNPAHMYQDTGTYLVQLAVTNQYGCTDLSELPIIIKPYYTFDVPNAFTPSVSGGNGGQYDPTSLLNDIFYPTTEYVDQFHMMIFNRWGELIFESFDINIGWDGSYRGKMAQQDVYVWKIDITYVDGKKLSKIGDLTLIR